MSIVPRPGSCAVVAPENCYSTAICIPSTG